MDDCKLVFRYGRSGTTLTATCEPCAFMVRQSKGCNAAGLGYSSRGAAADFQIHRVLVRRYDRMSLTKPRSWFRRVSFAVWCAGQLGALPTCVRCHDVLDVEPGATVAPRHAFTADGWCGGSDQLLRASWSSAVDLAPLMDARSNRGRMVAALLRVANVNHPSAEHVDQLKELLRPLGAAKKAA